MFASGQCTCPRLEASALAGTSALAGHCKCTGAQCASALAPVLQKLTGALGASALAALGPVAFAHWAPVHLRRHESALAALARSALAALWQACAAGAACRPSHRLFAHVRRPSRVAVNSLLIVVIEATGMSMIRRLLSAYVSYAALYQLYTARSRLLQRNVDRFFCSLREKKH